MTQTTFEASVPNITEPEPTFTEVAAECEARLRAQPTLSREERAARLEALLITEDEPVISVTHAIPAHHQPVYAGYVSGTPGLPQAWEPREIPLVDRLSMARADLAVELAALAVDDHGLRSNLATAIRALDFAIARC